ncbi:MAG: hypothetical protein HW386_1324 [Gammaproteobacteria bacterium]|nr:hypothetical protein [Gammaproteobacteria bacterium]
MWTDLLSAIALVFILEGVIPFINPDALRKMYLMATQLNNQTLRFIGLSSMLAGLVMLYLVR